ncbi:MAG: acetyl-CoA carboxylase biotin carboxyl carrier protein [Candidatus Eiseniibacteriota bacterium]
MNLRRTIQQLVQIMREEELAEIEVRRLFSSVRVRRPGGDPAMMAGATAPPAAASAESKEEAAPAANLIAIKSPMVGTFYRSPAPDADPYVEENSSIDVGQTVCIVEAMKLMNEIESDVKGRITSILVENGQPVEYGQVLFQVEAESAA